MRLSLLKMKYLAVCVVALLLAAAAAVPLQKNSDDEGRQAVVDLLVRLLDGKAQADDSGVLPKKQVTPLPPTVPTVPPIAESRNGKTVPLYRALEDIISDLQIGREMDRAEDLGAKPEFKQYLNLDGKSPYKRAVSTYPNIGRFQQGYNILYGNPFGSESSFDDPGLVADIFKLEYTQGTVSADQRYKVPDDTVVRMTQFCSTSFSSQTIKDTSDYANSLDAQVSVEGGYGGASFSASAGYKQASSGTETQKKVYIISKARCMLYRTEIDPGYIIPAFSDTFMAAISALGNGNAQDYYNFFDKFGTHYVKKMTFGSQYTIKSTMTETDYANQNSMAINVAIQAQYSGLFSVGGSASLDVAKDSAVKKFDSKTEKTTATIGGRPSANGDALAWAAESKQDNPAPLQLELGNIEDLLTSRHIGNADGIRSQMITHKATYCEYLRQKGATKSCDKPTPDPNANECEDGSDTCTDVAECLDTPSGYSCQCPAGFTQNGNDCDAPYPTNDLVMLRSAGLDHCITIGELFILLKSGVVKQCNDNDATMLFRIININPKYSRIECLFPIFAPNEACIMAASSDVIDLQQCDVNTFFQQWEITPGIGDGYTFKNRVSQKCLETNAERKVFSAACSASNRQQLWIIQGQNNQA